MTDWRTKFGWGALKDERRLTDRALAEDLSTAVRGRGSTFDSVVRSVVTQMLMQFVISWYKSVISKYTEEEYHRMIVSRCEYTNWSTGEKYSAEFDFLLDWQEHHRHFFNRFINAARKSRNRFDFDVDEVVRKVVYMLQTDAGWAIYPTEEYKFRRAIETVKAMIYA